VSDSLSVCQFFGQLRCAKMAKEIEVLLRDSAVHIVLDGVQTTPRREGGGSMWPSPNYFDHFAPELSMGWVDPWVGLGSVGLGWVGSTTAKVLKI